MMAYKLMRLRRDGTLGPLFIGRKQVIPLNKWLKAQDIKTHGFAHRPGWHATSRPYAPHLSKKGRVWCAVEIAGAKELIRPAIQGSTWYLARRMRVLRIMCGYGEKP